MPEWLWWVMGSAGGLGVVVWFGLLGYGVRLLYRLFDDQEDW